MKRNWLSLLILCLSLSLVSYSQAKEEKEIRALLATQIDAWNRGNIDEFMIGYWNDDSMMFIGKNGVTYGYTNSLKNYKKSYSDTAQMGKLKFDLLQVKKISVDAYFVVGKWFLKRSVGDIGGYYTLLFRKIKGKWVIVADHSS
jgi:ketosteroid isomerase-like protein